MEYGRYLSREFKKFEHSYEDWCPFCGERIVEHVALSGSLEHKVSESPHSKQAVRQFERRQW